jgi:hypothetical protein
LVFFNLYRGVWHPVETTTILLHRSVGLLALYFKMFLKLKVNAYLPSLVMKVSDHVYVLNDMHSSNTFQSVSFSVCQHETVITCASTDSLRSVFPHPCRNPCPHMRIRNEYQV